MSPESLSHIGRNLLNRKTFLNKTTGSLGFLGLSDLLNQNAYSEVINTKNFSGKDPIRPFIDANDPYNKRKSHFESAAKQVLIIYCPGAVSHVDTFDYKPDLDKYHGQKPPGIPSITFEGPTAVSYTQLTLPTIYSV